MWFIIVLSIQKTKWNTTPWQPDFRCLSLQFWGLFLERNRYWMRKKSMLNGNYVLKMWLATFSTTDIQMGFSSCSSNRSSEFRVHNSEIVFVHSSRSARFLNGTRKTIRMATWLKLFSLKLPPPRKWLFWAVFFARKEHVERKKWMSQSTGVLRNRGLFSLHVLHFSQGILHCLLKHTKSCCIAIWRVCNNNVFNVTVMRTAKNQGKKLSIRKSAISKVGHACYETAKSPAVVARAQHFVYFEHVIECRAHDDLLADASALAAFSVWYVIPVAVRVSALCIHVEKATTLLDFQQKVSVRVNKCTDKFLRA